MSKTKLITTPKPALFSLAPALVNEMIIYPESIQEEYDLGHLSLSLTRHISLILPF